MTKITKTNSVLVEQAEPPKLASWMVAQSYTKTNSEQGVEAFRAQFQDVDPDEARSWAYRFGWEKLHYAYEPLIDISMILLAVLGLVLALIGLLAT